MSERRARGEERKKARGGKRKKQAGGSWRNGSEGKRGEGGKVKHNVYKGILFTKAVVVTADSPTS